MNGKTTASFGPGISVGGAPEGQPGPVTVTGPGSATATITVDPQAVQAANTVMVQTGSDMQTAAGAFTISSCSGSTNSVVVDSLENFPLNGVLHVTYALPVNRSTVSNLLNLFGSAGNIPVQISVDVTGRIVTATPQVVLAPSSSIGLLGNYGLDECGASLPLPFTYGVTSTSLQRPAFGFLESGIASGMTNVPTTASVALLFNQPVSAATAASSISLSSAAGPVPGSISQGDGGRVLFVPLTPLAANTAYTVNIASTMESSAGFPLPHALSWTFTTGNGSSVNGYPYFQPYFSMYADPLIVATNAPLQAISNVQIDATSVNARTITLFDNTTQLNVPGTVHVSSDLLR